MTSFQEHPSFFCFDGTSEHLHIALRSQRKSGAMDEMQEKKRSAFETSDKIQANEKKRQSKHFNRNEIKEYG